MLSRARPQKSPRSAARPSIPPAAVSARVREKSLAASPLAGAQERTGAGFKILLIQLFIVYSRITDFIGLYLGISSSLVLIFSILALIAMVASGGLRFALGSKAGKLFTALTIWFLICTPFSVWRGGTVETLQDYWMKTYLYFIIVAGLLATVDQCRKVIFTLGIGSAVVCFASLVAHSNSDRLDLQGGMLGDPNTLAFFLILSIPCAALMIADRRGLFRAAGVVIACTLIVLSVRTGSRMGIIMLAAVLGLFWIRVSAIQKVGLLVATALLATVALLLSSPGTISRYRTMFSNNEDVDLSQNTEAADAVGSSMARRALLAEAWDYSLHHPIFGVGPGQFSAATGGNEEARSEHLAWHETHNTYLQLSSEAGFMAAILYIAVIIYSTRTTFRIYKRYKRDEENGEISAIAYVLLVSNIAFIVGAMFGSMAYLFPYPVVVAVVVGFERGVARYAAARQTEESAAPSPASHLAPQYT